MAREKSPQSKLLDDVKNRFKFHPATDVTGPQHDAVRADLGRLAQKVAKNLPLSREQSLVLTKLEEAMFWANAAIARNQADASSDVPARDVDGRAAKKAAAKAAPIKSARRVTRTART